MKDRHLSYIAAIAAILFIPFFVHGHAYTLADEPHWVLSPGDREYINYRPAGETTGGYSEHGLAYNPVTGNVYVIHHSSALGTLVAILDGQDGSHLGYLDTAGLPRALRKIGVADDGVIYAGTTSGDTATTPYYLYRWKNESADRELLWSGDPSDGQLDVRRSYGPNIAVRGEGASTQILVAPDWWEQVEEPHIVALFETEDGETFSPIRFITPPTTRFGLGTAFGPGDSFFGTRALQPLREFNFDGELVQELGASSFPLVLSVIGIDIDRGLLAAVHPNELWLYNFDTLNAGFNPAITMREFPTNNANIDATGEIAFGDDIVYALHTNNGIVAYPLVKVGLPDPDPPAAPGRIYWSNHDALRTSDGDGSNPRTVVSGLDRAIGVAVDPDNQHVYWVEDAAGRIGRANLDGTNAVILINGIHQPQGIALDLEGERLYWAAFSTGLFGADLDGSNAELLVEMRDQQITTVSYVPEQEKIYFGSALGAYYRVDPDGSNRTTVTAFGSDTYGTFYDALQAQVYATNFSGHTIVRYDESEWTTETLVSEGLNQPLHLTLNEERSALYWVERATGAETGGRVRTALLADPAAFTTLVEGENSPFGIALAPAIAATGFAEWIAGFPEIPADLQGPGDDPAHDGIANILKFALGLDPRVPSRADLPEPQLMSDAEGRSYLGISVARDSSATGVSLAIEVSGDLQNWDGGPGFITILEDTAEVLSGRDNIPIDESDRRFIRVRASSN